MTGAGFEEAFMKKRILILALFLFCVAWVSANAEKTELTAPAASKEKTA